MARRDANLPTPQIITTGLEAIQTFGVEDDQLYVDSATDYQASHFAVTEVLTAEENVRMIKAVEKHVRGCREYKTYLSYLRNDLGMTHCSFLPDVDVSKEVSLEFHHCPLTLYDVCQIIMDHRLAKGQGVTSLSLADEVLAAHFDNLIGLVPLTVTIHKLVHAGTILIHPSQVHGDWLGFLRHFPLGVNGGHVEKIIRFVQTTEEQVGLAAKKLRYVPGSAVRNDAALPSRAEIESLLLPAA